MEILFYCSYTNSAKGFLLTRLRGGKLEPVSLSGATDTGEQLADRFFSYDRFHILWQELMCKETPGGLPVYTGGFFGIRDLQGEISDRNGILNFAIVANSGGELAALGRVAAAILTDIEKFRSTVFSMLDIGGEAGYTIEAQNFMKYVKHLETTAPKTPPFYYTQEKMIETDLLRFAVYVSSWDDARLSLDSPGLFRDTVPKQAINEIQYRQILRMR